MKDIERAFLLLAKIDIENKNYAGAKEWIQRAINQNSGEPEILLWDVYIDFLEAEYAGELSEKQYEENIVVIMRKLRKIYALANRLNSIEITAYILYFWGIFYLKVNDVFAAKEKLEACLAIKPKSQIRFSANTLLDNIWNYLVKPPLWRWWLNSPINTWRRRFVFTILLIPLFLISTIMFFHPYVLQIDSINMLEFNWTLYFFLAATLLIAILLPTAQSFRAKDLEIELISGIHFEPVFPASLFEEKLGEVGVYSELLSRQKELDDEFEPVRNEP